MPLPTLFSFETNQQRSALDNVVNVPTFEQLDYKDKNFWSALYGDEIEALKKHAYQKIKPEAVKCKLQELQSMVGRLTLSPVVYSLGLFDLQKFLRKEIKQPEAYLDIIKAIRREWRDLLHNQKAFTIENFFTDIRQAIQYVIEAKWEVQNAQDVLNYYWHIIDEPYYQQAVDIAKNFFREFYLKEDFEEEGIVALEEKNVQELIHQLQGIFKTAVAKLPRVEKAHKETLETNITEEINTIETSNKNYLDKVWSVTKAVGQYVLDNPLQAVAIGLATQTVAVAAFNMPRSFTKRQTGSDDFQVNTYTTGNQAQPSVAHLINDNFVVAWASSEPYDFDASQDGSGAGIYGQIFNATGNPIGNEFRINTNTTNNQDLAVITGLTNGNFVAVWQSEGQDGSFAGIYSQIFTASGIPIGSEFRINNKTDSIQWQPTIAALNNGNFAVSWSDYGNGIFFRIFNATGGPLGSDIRANNYINGNQNFPGIANLSDENFILAWNSYEQAGVGTGYGIYGRIFNATGMPISNEFRANSLNTSTFQRPDITSLTNENFIMVWLGNLQGTSESNIYGRVFNTTAPLGDEFIIDSNTSISLQIPAIAKLDNEKFVVVWSAQSNEGYYGIFGKVFNATSILPIGNEFLANSYTGYILFSSEITGLTNGNFVTVWDTGNEQDGDRYGVFGRILKTTGLIATNTNQTITYLEDNQTSLAAIAIDAPIFLSIDAQLSLSYPLVGNLTTAIAGNTASTFNATTGLWQAVGDLNDINSLLYNIQFNPTANYNDNFTINVQISDGYDSPLLDTINVQSIAINDAPQLTGGNLENYTENAVPINVASNLNLIDFDDYIQNATITISSNFFNLQDILSFTPQAGIVGIYNNTLGRLTLSNNASVTNYLSALRSVTYQNLSDNPSNATRSITFNVNDGSVTSNNVTSMVNIIPVNDAPIVLNPMPDQTVIIDKLFRLVVPNNTFEDFEQDTLILYATTADNEALPSWISFDSVNREFVGQTTNPGKSRFSIFANDTSNRQASTNFTITAKTHQSNTSNNSLNNILIGVFTGIGGISALIVASIAAYRWRKNQSQRALNQLDLQNEETNMFEMQTSDAVRVEKNRTLIKNQYELVNKISRTEASALYEQTGIEVKFESDANKTRFTLGNGQFGKLRLAIDRQTNQFVGVKKIKGEDAIMASKGEAHIQSQFTGCPHLLPLLDSVETIGSNEKPVLYQFMPLAGWGNGDQFTDRLAHFRDDTLQHCLIHAARQLLTGVQAMHEKHIYHLDLKPSNIVFNNDGYLFIIDFGCALDLPDDQLTTGGVGDSRYFSPERLANMRYHTKPTGSAQEMIAAVDAAKVDAWAVGLTLLEWIIGSNPFAISSQGFPSKLALWDSVRYTEVLAAIPTLEQPATESLMAVVKGLLAIDPAKRLTVTEALAMPIFQRVDYQFSTDKACQSTFADLKNNNKIEEEQQPLITHISKQQDTNYHHNNATQYNAESVARSYGNNQQHSFFQQFASNSNNSTKYSIKTDQQVSNLQI